MFVNKTFFLLNTVCFLSCIAYGFSCAGQLLNFTIVFDDYPNETSWKVNSIAGNLIASGGPYNSTYPLSQSICLASMPACYAFTIFDLADDGICCDFGQGSYLLTLDDKLVAVGGNFEAEETVWFGPSCSVRPTSSPTRSRKPTRPTKKPTFRPTSLKPTVTPPCQKFNLTLGFDDFPWETTWYVKDKNGRQVVSGGPYNDTFEGKIINELRCLSGPPQCYFFTIFDLAGDGICCSFGIGYYSVQVDRKLVQSGGAFGRSESTTWFGASCGITPNNNFRPPTAKPTRSLTKKPSWKPSPIPSKPPSRTPTKKLTKKPTRKPTKRPTWKPSRKPTKRPTKKPTRKPTKRPTSRPLK